MKIGIIGSGNMGRSLGILWAELGHQVFFGARDAAKGSWVASLAGHGTLGGTNDEAAAFGNVLLYTVRGINPAAVLSSTDVLSGKILIDCNNFEIPEGFAYPPIVQSLAQKLATEVPNARVAKAFNTFSQEVFELAPAPLKDYQVSVFVCGDDELARKTVMTLASEIGFAPLDCGELHNARMVEELGNFIRFMSIGQLQTPYATISVNTLPASQNERLGGRQSSSLS